MDMRTQSAGTKTGVNGRVAARAKRPARDADVGEQLLAELAARRTRLQELLGLVRNEVAREMEVAAARRTTFSAARTHVRPARMN